MKHILVAVLFFAMVMYAYSGAVVNPRVASVHQFVYEVKCLLHVH